MSKTQPRAIDETAISPELDAAIRRNLCRSHPDGAETFQHTRSWHGSFPSYSVILEEGGEVVAHVGVVDRTIAVGGVPLRAAGVQNVFVVPEARGRGLSAVIMELSMREAAARGYDVGLLFCVHALEKVYAACGWINLGERETVRVEDGRELPIPGKNIAMFHPLAVKEFPGGLIHLRGNDW